MFKNGEFLMGIIAIVCLILLVVFWKVLMMGILFVVGAVVGLAIIGLIGKMIGTILAVFGLYKKPEGGDSNDSKLCR